MRLNADFSQRVVSRPSDRDWVSSPAAGVDRQMLDRIGDEVARATTLVRFAPGSAFDAHTHGGGEEFLVVDGTFSDESGDFPAGTYVRNPIGTAHAPHTDEGCTILVKLHQFDADDRAHFHVDTRQARFEPTADAGRTVLPLHRHGTERVVLERWDPGTAIPAHVHDGGAEVFVLEGRMQDADGTYPAGTWLRLPPGSRHASRTEDGCLLWIKTGHLTKEALSRWSSSA
ncbi:cupin domain-containing protein [Pseudaestuariivita atlantica]|uniref:Cupin n=1 Tax=Pseudaestuariivita atlantica TaxID=1317121 RepID=A0A0L1JN94_9RHOB|nr:cupin domain-containing protein [Pseudaestuariivita atlantica]KNG93226.1 cupin [Pseudaestuariivita atlantica]